MKAQKLKQGFIAFTGACLAMFICFEVGAFDWVSKWLLQVAGPNALDFTTATSAAFFSLCTAWIVLLLEKKFCRMKFGEAVILTWFLAFILTSLSAHYLGLVLPIAPISLTFLASGIGLLAARSAYQEDQNEYILNAFKTYVSPELVDEIAKNPNKLRIDGEKKELTVLFSDIAGFTSLSERVPPYELVRLLNQYFAGLTSIVHRHGGTLDKYIGDSVMAFWNAPTETVDHRMLATLAATDIDEFSKVFFASDKVFEGHDLKTRVGLNSGISIVGNFGSTFRFSYTAIGDEINVASRLESLNKDYGTSVLCTENVVSGQLDTANFKFRFVDERTVRGRDQSVKLFCPYKAPGFPDELDRRYAAAYAHYHNGDWLTAVRDFKKLVQDFPDDGPSKTLAKRCEKFQTLPPFIWDGVFRADVA